MEKISLGDRMKAYYEAPFKHRLPMRMPVIIRLDGRAFHTFTKKMRKPFDPKLIFWMDETAKMLCGSIQGAQIAYVQSDEISILVHGYKRLESQPWFDNEIQKMVSISAGMASSFFAVTFNDYLFLNQISEDKTPTKYGTSFPVFDSRVFVLPEAEVVNYFIWRQQDWTRNSMQMLARSLYSHKECHRKNNSELQEMIHQTGDNWNNLRTDLKRGRCVIKNSEGRWEVDGEIPVFTKDRGYIEKHLEVEEE